MDLTGKKFDLFPPMLGTASGPSREGPLPKPKAGVATGPQNTWSAIPVALPGSGFLGLTGASSTAMPFGMWGANGSPLFPGVPLSVAGSFYGWMSWGGSFIQPRRGNYWTYRLMDLNPTLALVRALIVGPILASQWTIKPSEWAADLMPVEEGGPAKRGKPLPWRQKLDSSKLENAVALVRDQLTATVRRNYLDEAARCLSFGWRGFEKVWSIRGGFYWFDEAKSLLPDWTNILHDGHGKFAGLGQGNIEGGELGPEKSFIVTYNGESGNLYGLPRHETAYDPWTDSQATRLREALYEGKMSGRLPKLHFKPGKTEMPAGSGIFVDNAVIAQQILATVVEGRGVAIPDLQYEDAELLNNPKLAGLSTWVLEMEDAGSNSEMLKGFQSILEYKDKLLVRSWLWPERAVLEAHHGTRADAARHTDTALIDREVIDDKLTSAFTESVVDDIVVLNFGEEYRGSVVAQPAPLVDSKVEVYTELLKAMAGNQTVAPELLAEIDVEEVLDHLDIEMRGDTRLNERFRALADEARQSRSAQISLAQSGQQGGGNGGGNGNGNGDKPKPAGAGRLKDE